MPAVCYHDGAYVPLESASLSVASLALRYALSVFEGIRLYVPEGGGPPRAFEMEAHLRRLRGSARLMTLPDPGIDAIPQIAAELAARNGIEADAYLRPSISAGNLGDLGTAARSTLTVTINPMGRKPWIAEDKRMRLQIGSWRRPPDAAFFAAAKNISNYAGPYVAHVTAQRAGFDGVVLLSPDGNLCEAPTAALFLVKDGVVSTPPLSDAVLPSITRQVVLELCRELGIPQREVTLTRADAYLADEAFLCGTGLEFGPIGAFDGFELAQAGPIPVLRRIMAAYFARARAAGAAGEPTPAPAPAAAPAPAPSEALR